MICLKDGQLVCEGRGGARDRSYTVSNLDVVGVVVVGDVWPMALRQNVIKLGQQGCNFTTVESHCVVASFH